LAETPRTGICTNTGNNPTTTTTPDRWHVRTNDKRSRVGGYARGNCGTCERNVALNWDGTLRRHFGTKQ